jgi:uncharacterized membrane protein YqhA
VTGETGAGERPAGTGLDARQAAENIPEIQRRFERLLASSRLLILLPVVMLLLIAAGTFIYGTVIFFASITGYIHDPARVGGKLSHFLIVEDLFLVGVTLMISAFGFYGLFVVRGEPRDSQYWLPRWLQMRDLEDLKARVVSMLILVAAMTFVDVVVEFRGGPDVLYLGVGVALVIVALTAFLRFGRQGHAPAVASAAPVGPAPPVVASGAGAGPASPTATASAPAATAPAAAAPAARPHAADVAPATDSGRTANDAHRHKPAGLDQAPGS